MSPRFCLAPLLLAFFWGCSSECHSSSQCADGQVCMHFEPGNDPGWNSCVVQCPEWGAPCADGNQCYCPDSPGGARCDVVGEDPHKGGIYACLPSDLSSIAPK